MLPGPVMITVMTNGKSYLSKFLENFGANWSPKLTVDQSAKNEKFYKQEEPMELMHSMGFTGVSKYSPFKGDFKSR